MATGLENLKIYQLARGLELEIHKITKGFPQDERWRSVDQLNRSAAAVSNNIAEAYHKQSIAQREHILRNIAIGEAEETRRNIERCSAKGFVTLSLAENIIARYTTLIKGIYGYVRFLKNQSTK